MTLNETSSELPSQPPSEPLAEAPSEPGEQVVTVIGFGRRLVAYLIDGIILWAVGLCLSVGGAALISGAGEDAAAGGSLALQCLSVLIALAYFVIFWATSGQTPGKMALGIKVIETDGSPVTWGKAVLRYIGYIISAVVVFLGFIWIAFDSKRQGWHDKIANTYVVRKETEFSGTEVTIVPSDEGSSTAIILVVLAFIVIVLLPIVVIAILLLLGPVIGNVFSNIVGGLGTPVPQ
jgi:uncharacterized RDD family membrane protein YckC